MMVMYNAVYKHQPSQCDHIHDQNDRVLKLSLCTYDYQTVSFTQQ